MSAPSMRSTGAVIGGYADPAYEAVQAAFTDNFAARGEIGAAVCVYRGQQKVVDLYGGLMSVERQEAWQPDTLVCMFSVGKGLAALCALMLADRGLMSLESPVAAYWPEFGCNGKEDLTVAHLLGHRAGLIYPDAAPEGALLDWATMTRALAAQRPLWPGGARGAYHSSTYGHLVGELVRRVSGVPVERFLAENIVQPLEVEYYFGVPAEAERRVATIIANRDNATLNAIANDPESPIGRAWRPLPRIPDIFNSSTWRRSVYPSASGHGNARAVARIYAALANHGVIDGIRLLQPAGVELARTEQWHEECGLTGRRYRVTLGFGLNDGLYNRLGPNPSAFGHSGAGGSLGFADPENRLAFSYCTNYPAAGDATGERCDALVRALYLCA